MVKNKTICLDEDIFEQLKEEPNASALIVKLLKEYFDSKNLRNLSIPELEQKLEVATKKEEAEAEIKKAEEIKKQAEEKIRKLENGN